MGRIEKKYELTKQTITHFKHTLIRIRALRDFGTIKKGELGGYVESEKNLSHYGDCWVYDDAWVYGNARVLGDARVCAYARVFGRAYVYGRATINGKARIFGRAEVFGSPTVDLYALVYGSAKVCGNAWVSDNALIYGNVRVNGNARIRGKVSLRSIEDYVVFKNWWSSGRYITWTRPNNMWHAGCFYGTGKELVAKAYEDSKKSGREYERIVKYVESILTEYKKRPKRSKRPKP